MEKIIIMIPVLVIVGFVGVTIGMYISSQIKCHISSSINNKELIKNLNEKKKIEQQESQILGQKPGNWTRNKGKETNERGKRM